MTEPANSLGRDAWRRFRRSRAAMAGGVVIALIAALGLLADVIAAHVTHFSLDEQHTEFRLKPPGTRDVSKDHNAFDGDVSHFDALDLDGDGVLGGEAELQDLYWIDRFLLFAFNDYDLASAGAAVSPAERAGRPAASRPDDLLSFEEYPAGYDALDEGFRAEFTASVKARLPDGTAEEAAVVAARARFHGLGLDRDAVFARMDADGDRALSLNEMNEHRRCYRLFESPERAILAMDKDGDGVVSRDEYPGAPRLFTFWLGTDQLGRDLLTRLFYGARISMLIAVLATLVSFLIGVTWGLVAGYSGGRIDGLMMRFVDVMYGLPFMFIVILLIVVFGRSTINLFIALGAVQWLTMSRVVRGQVLSLKHREFVQAAVALGVGKTAIVFRHLLRNTVGPVIVYATLMVPAIILEESFLSFLGLGVQPPYPSWGNMITDGAKLMDAYPWTILYPGLFLGLTLFAMNFVGDGLRDALDPQMRKD